VKNNEEEKIIDQRAFVQPQPGAWYLAGKSEGCKGNRNPD
jgi:hypothetical protein